MIEGLEVADVCPTCGQLLPISVAPLAAFLRQTRIELGLSQRDVERLTGGWVNNSTLSQIETGKVGAPRAETIWLLCKAYGIKQIRLADFQGPAKVDDDVTGQ
jgi:transcriptional regulator with XRE-family HTH domain